MRPACKVDCIGESKSDDALFAGSREFVRLFEKIIGIVFDYADVLRRIFRDGKIMPDSAILVFFVFGLPINTVLCSEKPAPFLRFR